MDTTTENPKPASLRCDGIVRRFFFEHPEHRDGVTRANLAYHANHREAGAHYFACSGREAPCRWCGQTREGVRWGWYGKQPTCQARPKWADESIESVIAREEKLFEKVLARAKKLASEIDVAELTGDELARLHHTHGVDPSMLEVALMEAGRSLPQQLHDDYQRAYEEHRATGKRGLVREVIVAKTAESSLSNAESIHPESKP
jgi:hypothetical protein